MKVMNDYIKQELSDGKSYNEILENFQSQLTKLATEAEQKKKEEIEKRKNTLGKKLDEFFMYNGIDTGDWDELTLCFGSDGRIAAFREKFKKDERPCHEESRAKDEKDLTFEEFLRDLFG